MPAISVLLPVYNAAATLKECIDSVLQQSHTDFELVVINDHSTDASMVMLAQYDDKRIRLVDNPAKGLVSALNFGLQQCLAPYVARMDADDIMRPQRLQKQLAHMQLHAELALVASQVRKFPEEIIKNGYEEYMRWQNACITRQHVVDQIYIESPFAHPSVMYKKSDVTSIGAYREGDFPEDYDLWLRMHHAGFIMDKVPEVLLDWRESEGRLSRTSPSYRREAFDRLRAVYLAKDVRLQHKNIIYWGAGRKTRQRSRHLIDQGYKPTAWIDIDPKKIGNIIEGARVERPDWLKCNESLINKKTLILSYVTNHGARDKVRTFLDGIGCRLGHDYLEVG